MVNNTDGSLCLFYLYGYIEFGIRYPWYFGYILPCRLLLLAKFKGWILVHPVALCDAEAVLAQAGAHAHPHSG